MIGDTAKAIGPRSTQPLLLIPLTKQSQYA